MELVKQTLVKWHRTKSVDLFTRWGSKNHQVACKLCTYSPNGLVLQKLSDFRLSFLIRPVCVCVTGGWCWDTFLGGVKNQQEQVRINRLRVKGAVWASPDLCGGDQEEEEEVTSAHTSIDKHAITMCGTVCGCTAPIQGNWYHLNKMLSLSTCL